MRSDWADAAAIAPQRWEHTPPFCSIMPTTRQRPALYQNKRRLPERGCVRIRERERETVYIFGIKVLDPSTHTGNLREMKYFFTVSL